MFVLLLLRVCVCVCAWRVRVGKVLFFACTAGGDARSIHTKHHTPVAARVKGQAAALAAVAVVLGQPIVGVGRVHARRAAARRRRLAADALDERRKHGATGVGVGAQPRHLVHDRRAGRRVAGRTVGAVLAAPGVDRPRRLGQVFERLAADGLGPLSKLDAAVVRLGGRIVAPSGRKSARAILLCVWFFGRCCCFAFERVLCVWLALGRVCACVCVLRGRKARALFSLMTLMAATCVRVCVCVCVCCVAERPEPSFCVDDARRRAAARARSPRRARRRANRAGKSS